jgi:hypothetical protein
VKEDRIMSLKYSIVSILGLVILLLLVFENHEVWAQPIESSPKPQKEETKPLDKKGGTLPAMGSAKDTPPIQANTSIAEKNIFSPDRKDFLAPGGTNKPITRPQVVLYGVTIAGDYQAASVSNPGRPLRKGEREIFTVKVGEKIGDYKLAKISGDRITLEADGDNFEVLLYDSKTPKKRIETKTETKPATITGMQPGPSMPTPRMTAPPPPPVSAPMPMPSLPPTTVTPPSPGTGATTVPPPAYGRGRRPYYPPPGTPGPTPQGTGGNP